MIANLLPCGSDGRDNLRITACALANQEKGRTGVMPREDAQHLRRVRGIGTVVKCDRDQGFLRFDTPHDARKKPFDHADCKQWLDDEDEEHHGKKSE